MSAVRDAYKLKDPRMRCRASARCHWCASMELLHSLLETGLSWCRWDDSARAVRTRASLGPFHVHANRSKATQCISHI
jgi:hypothetical protein